MPIPVIFLAFANEGSNNNPNFLRNLTVEKRFIEDALKNAELNNRTKIYSESDVTLDELYSVFQDERYRDKIVIFHYAGHANENELWVETADGGNASFFGAGLAEFLGLQRSLKLVFLNGCATEEHANRLLDVGIPAVLATSHKIDDAQATLFARTFYRGIAGGASIERAFGEAQSSVLARFGASGVSRELYWEGKDTTSTQEKPFPWKLFINKEHKGFLEPQDWKLFYTLDNGGGVAGSQETGSSEDSDDPRVAYIGKVVQNYKITKYLGSGAYGNVFRAKHLNLEKEAAIKISHRISEGYERLKDVMYLGAKGLTKLKHPNIAEVYDVGELGFGQEKRIYIIMELVKGNRLDQIDWQIEQMSRRDLKRIKTVLMCICHGVHAAHTTEYDNNGFTIKGIIHGNIRTRKVLFTYEEEPKLIDFMFTDLTQSNNVKIEQPPYVKALLSKESLRDYFPKERIEKGIINVQTDIYSIGAVCFSILSGMKLRDFTFHNSREIYTILKKRNRNIPRYLSVVIFKALQEDPEKRYKSVQEIIDDLESQGNIFRRFLKWLRRIFQ